MTDRTDTIAIDDIECLPTAVALHGSARQADVTGQVCFSVAVALATYSGR